MSWQCPFCGNHATVREDDAQERVHLLHRNTSYGIAFLKYRSVRCPNQECKELSLSVEFLASPAEEPKKPDTSFTALAESQLARRQAGAAGLQHSSLEGLIASSNAEIVNSWRLLPESEAKPQPDCVPQLIQKDYKEACLIKDKSPKASATLSRRCLQAMIQDFWGIKDKKNLAQEIEAIKGEVDPNTWKAIDAVRKIGNIGAHMEKDVNLIVDIEPREAGALIGLIEMLFKDWYIVKEERENALKGIVEMAQQKGAQKKQSSKDFAPPKNEPE